eukprot:MONOS_10177.1-p1 / transcript=MONOS_10177.1 / gene=MONOS_10177 / organism=Monocercomonoides_exilis_PA203 / gene_product=unspecified product / transcript_product=unspecified product / location=Mono_scaffold00451:39543-40826(-) / protein_length=408 / sequence_SO=supercontig / SO=protein_coding / is_pseudo=false
MEQSDIENALISLRNISFGCHAHYLKTTNISKDIIHIIDRNTKHQFLTPAAFCMAWWILLKSRTIDPDFIERKLEELEVLNVFERSITRFIQSASTKTREFIEQSELDTFSKQSLPSCCSASTLSISNESKLPLINPNDVHKSSTSFRSLFEIDSMSPQEHEKITREWFHMLWYLLVDHPSLFPLLSEKHKGILICTASVCSSLAFHSPLTRCAALGVIKLCVNHKSECVLSALMECGCVTAVMKVLCSLKENDHNVICLCLAVLLNLCEYAMIDEVLMKGNVGNKSVKEREMETDNEVIDNSVKSTNNSLNCSSICSSDSPSASFEESKNRKFTKGESDTRIKNVDLALMKEIREEGEEEGIYDAIVSRLISDGNECVRMEVALKAEKAKMLCETGWIMRRMRKEK